MSLAKSFFSCFYTPSTKSGVSNIPIIIKMNSLCYMTILIVADMSLIFYSVIDSKNGTMAAPSTIYNI